MSRHFSQRKLRAQERRTILQAVQQQMRDQQLSKEYEPW
jgi:hypothetical protein